MQESLEDPINVTNNELLAVLEASDPKLEQVRESCRHDDEFKLWDESESEETSDEHLDGEKF